ncbi:phage protein NinX family protein [Pseudomonas aeruginosa]
MVCQTTLVEVRAEELADSALDWAVAIAIHGKVYVYPDGGFYPPENSVSLNDDDFTLWVNNGEGDTRGEWSPSTDWSQCGPLIDAYIHTVGEAVEPRVGWNAVGGKMYLATARTEDGGSLMSFGKTRLIAACRAIVESRLGRQVHVPAQLLATGRTGRQETGSPPQSPEST